MNRTKIMTALFNLLKTAGTRRFLADSQDGSAVLTNASSTAGLVPGLPAFGPGVQAGTAVANFDSSTVTLTRPIKGSSIQAWFNTGFQTVGRGLQMLAETTAMPALFVCAAHDRYAPRATRMPPKVTLGAEAWIYATSGYAPHVPHEDALNPMIDAIESLLLPLPPTEAITLGGLVTHCWPEPEIERWLARIEGPAIAIVPIKMLVPL
jgi:hypothetical protein